ncbi:hypothetical protein [Flavihumibacter fluvii]|uniref:AbiU2 domain-containing protein n=1 Tax=Flavihumibacter fluvii TaxID=2838157 RepID=UPI001BDF15CC|nr:hypothetical protein [Flavihumibacter fluvii]ULQ51745.1 hypothetical protein KJS93_16785 [Flavihumibacter fluvii]
MDIKPQLLEKLDKISRVYIFAQEAYLYTEYFHKPDTKEELELVTNSAHASEISVIMHLMFRTLIVEVSKLFSRSTNDRYQLNIFIESLTQNGHFREINISPEMIELWRSNIQVKEYIINNIIVLRDKIYAHTDNPMKKYAEVDITLNQIASLLEIAKEIICYIYTNVFSTTFLTDSPTFDRERFTLLKLLAKAESNRLGDIKAMYLGGRT